MACVVWVVVRGVREFRVHFEVRFGESRGRRRHVRVAAALAQGTRSSHLIPPFTPTQSQAERSRRAVNDAAGW